MRAAGRRCRAALCNQGVKFTDLIAFARELGADCLATGHYVRRIVREGGAEFHKGADPRARPELFPLRHDARAARFPALSRWAICPRARCAGWRKRRGWRSRPSPTARTSASSPTAIMPGWSSGCARKPTRPARSSTSTAACSAQHRGRRPLHRRPAPRDRDRRPDRAALRRPHRPRARDGWSSARARALAVEAMRVEELELDRRGAERGQRQGPLARARGAGGHRRRWVRFDRAEFGVAPGQAAVVYDGTRLLGGGWIAETARPRELAAA